MGHSQSTNLDEVIEQNFTIFTTKLQARLASTATVDRYAVRKEQYEKRISDVKSWEIPVDLNTKSYNLKLLSEYAAKMRCDGGDSLLPCDPSAKYWRSLPVTHYGPPQNRTYFLVSPIFDVILPYLAGDVVLQYLPFVCTNWFFQFHRSLLCERFYAAIGSFVEAYSKLLRIHEVAMIPQNVMRARQGCRVDLVIYAEVLDSCENKLVEINHGYRYERTFVTKNIQNMVVPKNSSFSTDRNYLACYQFYTHARGKPRDVWLITDMNRRNREDIRLSQTPPIGLACVGDLIELPVNTMSDFGCVDPQSLIFKPPSIKYGNPPEQPDFAETCHDVWQSYDKYKQHLNHRITDLAADLPPHVICRKQDGIGSALPTIRQIFSIEVPGDCKAALNEFGQLFMIQEKNKPICVTLGRMGLQHDRLQFFWLRQGDQLYLYRVTGGPLEF